MPFRGGIKNLGKPELMQVMQRRKVDADGKPGPIKANRASSAKSTCEGELAAQLARRTQIINDVSKQTLMNMVAINEVFCSGVVLSPVEHGP